MAIDLPLTTIGVILAFALVLSILVKRLGQNPVLGFILTGFILGPFVLNFVKPEDILVKAFAELGLFVLLFYLGIELSFKDFVKSGVPTFSLALLDLLALGLTGLAISLLAGFSLFFSIIVGIMLFCHSSAIVGKFIIDNGLVKQASAQIALAVLIVEDFLGILLLVFVTSFSGSGSALELSMISLVFAVVSFYAVHRLSGLVEKIFEKYSLSDTELTLYGIGIGLIVATLGGFLNLSPAIGAYFAGFALSELKAGEKVKKQLHFLRDFFLLFFFVAFGATIFFDPELQQVVIPPLNELVFLFFFTGILTLAIITINAVIFTIFGPLFGLTNRASSEVAVFLTPLGEFVIIIAISVLPLLKGTEAAFISPIAFLSILWSLLIFQPLYKRLDMHDKITSRLPALAQRPTTEQPAKVYTHESIEILKMFGLNLFILLCLSWITVLLYKAIPVLGIQVPFGRPITTVLVFLFFAIIPLAGIFNSTKKLWRMAAQAPINAQRKFAANTKTM